MCCCGAFIMPFEPLPEPTPRREPSPAPKPLTGRGVLVALGLFFGTMIVANGALIHSALRSLPGGVRDNAYEASQAYNGVIAQARARDARHYRGQVSVRPEADGARVVFELRDSAGAPVPGALIDARFEHPSDGRADRAGRLAASGEAHEAVIHGVHAGAWTLVVEARQDGETVFVTRNRVTLAPVKTGG